MGFLPPPVHIRDNLDLAPGDYRILLKGVEIGRGEIQPERWMAIDPGCAEGELPGQPCREPAFGLPAIWIDDVLREQASIQGYTVVDPSSVVATHLNHLISLHTDELFSRQETQQLLDQVSKEMPKLVEDFIPGSSRSPLSIRSCRICWRSEFLSAICAPLSIRWRSSRPRRATPTS